MWLLYCLAVMLLLMMLVIRCLTVTWFCVLSCVPCCGCFVSLWASLVWWLLLYGVDVVRLVGVFLLRLIWCRYLHYGDWRLIGFSGCCCFGCGGCWFGIAAGVVVLLVCCLLIDLLVSMLDGGGVGGHR